MEDSQRIIPTAQSLTAASVAKPSDEAAIADERRLANRCVSASDERGDRMLCRHARQSAELLFNIINIMRIIEPPATQPATGHLKPRLAPVTVLR